MGLYNFKPQFAPFILDGTKTHTIRAPRRYPDVAGATMHLYTGLRQRGARLLMRVRCNKVEQIEISPRGNVRIDGERLIEDELNPLAWSDGFRGRGMNGAFDEMLEFWTGRLPFVGQVYHWEAP